MIEEPLVEPREARSPSNLLWYPCIFLTGITLLPFLQVCGHEFILFDDPDYVTGNPWVQSGLSWSSLAGAFTSTTVGFWQPLLTLSFEVDAGVFGPEAAWGFHLSNLLWHLVNVLIVFHLLVR